MKRLTRARGETAIFGGRLARFVPTIYSDNGCSYFGSAPVGDVVRIGSADLSPTIIAVHQSRPVWRTHYQD